ncbi:MAG: hypothetical protein HBSAPP03_21400 [Phycisphaerae bacterium]|nr:MAG: hypothetical protein HBSAPP03_21400 [Phycisphaerae bacterium]
MLWLMIAAVVGCAGHGRELVRRGDEIVVAGRYFHTGAPVVLWTDPGGYDAYRVERRFVPLDKASWEATAAEGKGPESPNRYGWRKADLPPDVVERVRGGGWDLETLRGVVDQFVIHYDVCGTSRQCFRILHDVRGLSVHFMLDLDGTIYQTLDVKERAWHAGTANDRGVGIEIANIGAYPPATDGAELPPTLARWYAKDEAGRWRVTLPSSLGDGGLRTPGYIARPARNGPVIGRIHGQSLMMFDLTDAQYESLIRLTATLHRALPRIRLDAPRDAGGALRMDALSEDEMAAYSGLLGHHHVTKGKIDPGPAFDWERVITGARRLVR